MIEQIERNLFFRFTRVFAWIIIIPTFIVLIAATLFLIKNYIKSSANVIIDVKYEDVKQVINKKGKYQTDSQTQAGSLTINRLDSISVTMIDDILIELKAAFSNAMNSEIKKMVNNNSLFTRKYYEIRLENKIKELDKEAKERLIEKALTIKNIVERNHYLSGLRAAVQITEAEKKLEAFGIYDKLWQEKRDTIEADMTRIKQQQTVLISVFCAAFAGVALFSLLLVLLSIERNTRK